MEYGGKVYVADNHRISVTLKESVYEAKHMADRGCGAGDIKEYLECSAYQSSIYVAVNFLKYLKKSGCVTASAAAVAGMLNIKPVFTIQGEKRRNQSGLYDKTDKFMFFDALLHTVFMKEPLRRIHMRQEG